MQHFLHAILSLQLKTAARGRGWEPPRLFIFQSVEERPGTWLTQYSRPVELRETTTMFSSLGLSVISGKFGMLKYVSVH